MFVRYSCSNPTRKMLNFVLYTSHFLQVFYAAVELITDWTYVDMLHMLLPDVVSHYVAAGWWVYSSFIQFSIVIIQAQ